MLNAYDYSGRPRRVIRGPWFKPFLTEQDGLETFYVRKGPNGKEYLLSNNLSWQDRENLDRLYQGAARCNMIVFLASLYVGLEGWTIMARRGAIWKARASMGILGWATASISSFYYFGRTYRPLINAYFHKYSDKVKNDMFEIKDEKREWFEIDTSSPTSYTNEEVAEQGYHYDHSPLPDGEVFSNSWLMEMDKFLDGKDNNLKNHKLFLNYKFDYHARELPTAQQVEDLFARPSAPPSAHRTNLAKL